MRHLHRFTNASWSSLCLLAFPVCSLLTQVAVSKWRRHQRPITSQRTEPHPDLESATYRLPKFASGRKLRLYQEEAVYWMARNYAQHRNCMLGDEVRILAHIVRVILIV